MPHHALCHTPSLAAAFRAAARRAWSRRCLSTRPSPPPPPPSNPGPAPHTEHSPWPFRIPTTRKPVTPQTTVPFHATLAQEREKLRQMRAKPKKERAKAHETFEWLDPSTLSPEEHVDPGRATSADYGDRDPPWELVTIDPRPEFRLPIPATPHDLYQNLLYLVYHHKPLPLPRLIAYHASYDPHLHSTRSYNLLVSLSLRHAVFGTAEALIRTMLRAGVPQNLESWKLRVRWHVQSGRWESAWAQVVAAAARGDIVRAGEWAPVARPAAGTPAPAIPLLIWLEFFGGLKRGAFRRRVRDADGAWRLVPVVEDDAQHAARAALLLAHLPALPRGDTRMAPRTAAAVVRMLLRAGDRRGATAFSTAYLRALPAELPAAWARECLEIVHLHAVFAPARLAGHYAARRVVAELLGLHGALRPTPRTLFLLLRGLRRAQAGAAVAARFVHAFRARWGAEMADGRVRRRAAGIALKEGRVGMVKAIFWEEAAAREAARAWAAQEAGLGGAAGGGPGALGRLPAGELFRGHGSEARRWKRLQARTVREIAKRAPAT